MAEATSTLTLKVDTKGAKAELDDLKATLVDFKKALTDLPKLSTGQKNLEAEVAKLKTEVDGLNKKLGDTSKELDEWRNGLRRATTQATSDLQKVAQQGVDPLTKTVQQAAENQAKAVEGSMRRQVTAAEDGNRRIRASINQTAREGNITVRLSEQIDPTTAAQRIKAAQAQADAADFSKKDMRLGGLGLDLLDSAVIKLDTRLKAGLKALEARKVQAERDMTEAEKLSRKETKLGGLGLDLLDSAVIKLDTRLKNGLKVLEQRRKDAERATADAEKLTKKDAKLGGLGLDLLNSAVIKLDTRLKNGLKVLEQRRKAAERELTEAEKLSQKEAKLGGLGLDLLDSAVIRLDARLKNGLKALELRRKAAERDLTEAEKLSRKETKLGGLGLDLLDSAVIRLDARLKNGLKVLEQRRKDAERAVADAEKLSKKDAKLGSLGLDNLNSAVIQLDARLESNLKRLKAREKEVIEQLVKNSRFLAGNQFTSTGTQMFQAHALKGAGFETEAIRRFGSEIVANSHRFDEHRRKVQESTEHTRRFTEAQHQLHSALRGVAGGLGGLWLTYGRYVPLMVTAFAAVTAIKKSLADGIEFDYQTRFIAAISDNPGPTKFLEVQQQLRDVSKDSIANLNEMARALRVLQQTGVEASQGVGLLKTITAASVLGETDMKTAAEDLVAVLEVYDLHSHDPEKLADNFKRAGDIMAYVAQETKANLHDVAESLKGVTGVAEQYGVRLEEVAAMAASLGKQGIVGQRASTYMRTMIEAMFVPTSQAAEKYMKALNFSAIDETTGRYKALKDQLVELVTKLRELDSVSRDKAIDAMFPSWGRKAFRAVNNDLDAFLARLEEASTKTTGLLQKQTEMLAESTRYQLKQLGADWDNLFINAFEANQDVTEMAKAMREALADPAVLDALSGMVSLTAEVARGITYLTTRFEVFGVTVPQMIGGVVTTIQLVGRAIAGVIKDIETGVKLFGLTTSAGVPNPVKAYQNRDEIKKVMEDRQRFMEALNEDANNIAMQYGRRGGARTSTSVAQPEKDPLADFSGRQKKYAETAQAALKAYADYSEDIKRKVMQNVMLAYFPEEGKPKRHLDLSNARGGAKGANALFRAEQRDISQEYDAAIRKLQEQFNHEKQIFDQRVKYGALSQDAANLLLEGKQEGLWAEQIKAAEHALSRIEKEIKASDEAQRRSLETQKKGIQLKLEETKTAQEHALVLRQERAELEARRRVRELDNDIRTVTNKEDLERAKFATEHQKQYASNPVTQAGDQAYLASLSATQGILQKYEQQADNSKKRVAELTENIGSLRTAMDLMGPPTLAQIRELEINEEALRKDAEAANRDAEAYERIKVVLEELAQKRRQQAEGAATYDRTFEAGTRKAFNDFSNNATNAAKRAEEFWGGAIGKMSDTLTDFVVKGKLDFKSLTSYIGDQLTRIAINEMLSGMFDGMGGGRYTPGRMTSRGGSDAGFFGNLISWGMNLWSGFSGFAGSGYSNLGSGLTLQSVPATNPSGWAKGGSFVESNPVKAFAKGDTFANRIYSTPTHFRYGSRRDQLGVMGEAGPEGIFPLGRDRRGRLAVRMVTGRAGLDEMLPVTRDGAGRLSVAMPETSSPLRMFANGAAFGNGEVFHSPMANRMPLDRSASPSAPANRESREPGDQKANQRPIQITMNIQTQDSGSFRQSQGQILAEMNRALAAGRRNM
jgi:TP901 family phage tail tape measure protein/lambda family phage tail tape measure protein